MFRCISPYFTDVVIGFDPDSYTVDEGAPGIVTFTVRVLTGQLRRSVEIGFSTLDDTALGMVCSLCRNLWKGCCIGHCRYIMSLLSIPSWF